MMDYIYNREELDYPDDAYMVMWADIDEAWMAADKYRELAESRRKVIEDIEEIVSRNDQPYGLTLAQIKNRLDAA